jgi:hypothetical protein
VIGKDAVVVTACTLQMAVAGAAFRWTAGAGLAIEYAPFNTFEALAFLDPCTERTFVSAWLSLVVFDREAVEAGRAAMRRRPNTSLARLIASD